jgi:hypothetical protein
MSKLLSLAIAVSTIMLGACANSEPPEQTPTPPSDLFQSGEDCFSDRYRDPIGLEVGKRGQFALGNFTFDVENLPFEGETVGYFEPFETFTVLEGPVCWALPVTSNTAMTKQRRFWRVRSNSRDLEGWIDEYVWIMTQDTTYFVHPVGDDETPLEIGEPLASPIVFEDTVSLSEGLNQTHYPTYQDYGYVSVNLDIRLPAETAAERPEECAIVAYVPDIESIRVGENSLQVMGRQVERLFVHPGSYEFRVGYFFPGPDDCPDIPYTLTFMPFAP